MQSIRERIQTAAVEQFSRSGGPGGQNVNKVNTQVTLRVPIAALDLTHAQETRVRSSLAGRINRDDELLIQVSDTRSQSSNREIALDRATELILESMRPPRRRRPTKPTRASRERRLQHKRARSQRKQQRSRPRGEE